MALPVEKEPKSEISKEIKQPLESFPEAVEKLGVKTRPTQVTQQVTDKGKPLIQTPPTKVITIQPPADQQQVTTWAKGSPLNAITWLAVFWLRMIRKALHFGWKIIGGKKIINKKGDKTG
jgi:hypothetical protein